MPEEQKAKFVKLLMVTNEAERTFLQSIMERADIPYYFMDEGLGLSSAIMPSQVPTYLMVEEKRAADAQTLLNKLRRSDA